MSLLEHLDRLSNRQTVINDEQEQRNPPFGPGTPVISLDNYLVQASTEPTDNDCCRPAYDVNTGQVLNSRIYDQKTFHTKAHLLFANVRGVCGVRDVRSTNEGVFVFSNRSYGDLHAYLRAKKKLGEAQAAPLFRQIVEMVRDAHRQNIALRDIKLKKFVFTDKECTILSLSHLDDAQLMDHTGLLTDKHGCPAYICPEKLQADSYSGKAADLWSLGVILYTLLVGNYPFFDSTPQELFSKVRTGYYQIPEHVSYLARTVISSLLTYDPTSRVPAVAILENPWFKVALEDQPKPLFVPTRRIDQTVPK